MGAPVVKAMKLGDLVVSVYDFKLKGDVLPMHSHDESSAHISICARGGFVCLHEGGKAIPLPCGAVLDSENVVTHEFEATEDDSRLVNIIKHVRN
jgi:quercetin dioxygenase-like cupin family protein